MVSDEMKVLEQLGCKPAWHRDHELHDFYSKSHAGLHNLSNDHIGIADELNFGAGKHASRFSKIRFCWHHTLW